MRAMLTNAKQVYVASRAYATILLDRTLVYARQVIAA